MIYMNKALDLTGQRSGKLTAIEPTEERRHGSVVWKCKCECGQICFVCAQSFQAKAIKSCGCLRHKTRDKIGNGKKYKKHVRRDLEGKRFGRLTAIEPTDERKYGQTVWKCKCECGHTHYTTRSTLTQGFAQSCGCLHAEKQALSWLRKRFKTKDEAIAFVANCFDDTTRNPQ